MFRTNDDAGQLNILQEEIATLKKELEDKDWVCQKTSEGVKALYKELEKHRDRLEELVKERTERLEEEITGHKQAEEKAAEERDRAELYLDILSHDINNLDSAVILLAEQLLMKADFPQGYRENIQRIIHSALAISKLIANVRKLSELREGEFPLKDIDVFQVLYGALEQTNFSYPGRKIQIKHSIPKSRIFVRGNELLQDVFENILGNAVKHNHEKVIMDILCGPSSEGNYWKIEFKDHGQGVPDEMKKKIFERLERGDKRIHGSGLGLTIVREVIKRGGGKVWVEDRIKGDPGKGSNFVLLLPKGRR